MCFRTGNVTLKEMQREKEEWKSMFLKRYTKEEKSWMMYDWANSAHSVIVVTILPIFFNSIATERGMSIWGYATSAAMLIVALMAPVMGAFGVFLCWSM